VEIQTILKKFQKAPTTALPTQPKKRTSTRTAPYQMKPGNMVAKGKTGGGTADKSAAAGTLI